MEAHHPKIQINASFCGKTRGECFDYGTTWLGPPGQEQRRVIECVLADRGTSCMMYGKHNSLSCFEVQCPSNMATSLASSYFTHSDGYDISQQKLLLRANSCCCSLLGSDHCFFISLKSHQNMIYASSLDQDGLSLYPLHQTQTIAVYGPLG